MKLRIFFPLFFFLFGNSYAHCPLCTIGAAAAAGGAQYLGVHTSVVSLFIGAFAVSTGWMFANYIKKEYIPFQKPVIILFAFVTTILPLMPFFGGSYFPFSLFLFGDYGSLLNTTYLVDIFLIGSIVGAAIVSVTPWMSKKIGTARREMIPFQGILLTLALLLITGTILQFAF